MLEKYCNFLYGLRKPMFYIGMFPVIVGLAISGFVKGIIMGINETKEVYARKEKMR